MNAGRFFWVGLLFVVAVAASGRVHAQVGTGGVVRAAPQVLNTFVTPSGATLYSAPGWNTPRLDPRVWSSLADSSVGVVDKVKVSGMAGGDLAATAGRVINAQRLLQAAIVYGTWDQAVGFGDAINGWLGQSRCVPLRFGETEQSLCDPGSTPVTNTVTMYGAGENFRTNESCPRGTASSPDGAVACLIANIHNCHINGNSCQQNGPAAAGSNTCISATMNGTFYTCYYQASVNSDQVQKSGCPAITDPYYVGYNTTPDGSPGPDGKCRTGTYQPNPYADAVAKIKQYGDPSRAKDAAKDLVDSKGASIDADAGSLTGPASVSGTPSSTTRTNPDGSSQTTTTTPTYNYTYTPTTITVTTTTATTVNNYDAAGNLTGTTTEESSPKPEEPPPVDSPLPELPKLYTAVYPDGIAGVWAGKQSAFAGTPAMVFLQGLVPGFGDTGGCPSFSLPSGNVMGIAVGGIFDVPCSVYAFIRVVMLIGALFLARALIFGG